MENKKRSLTKAITWRVAATVVTVTLVYIFTGSLTLSLEVGFFEVMLKMLVYFVHERTWNKITWGRKDE